MSGPELDVHDSLLTGYSVDGLNRMLVMHTQPHQGGGTDWIDVIFHGITAYHFEGDCLENIVFDIEEIAADTVTNTAEFEERNRLYGAPTGWDRRRETGEQFFSRTGCRVFEIQCSYGLHGWVAAETCDRIVVKPRPAA
jgi:hypothetical protein